MNRSAAIRLATSTLAALPLLVSCSRQPPHEAAPRKEDASVTNRLAIPPEVVANLGITFAEATRGKVGVWTSVPGELYVPATHRWRLRAPARGRLTAIASRWTEVEAGDEVAELLSPQLNVAQQELLAAHSRLASAQEVADAARARLAESDALAQEAKELVNASRQRLEHLQEVGKNAAAFASKELLEARRASATAAQSALQAAVRRDELREAAREKDLARAQAGWLVEQKLAALALLTGRTPDELLARNDGVEAWRALESIVVRAPARGTVVEVPASRGETVDEDETVAVLLDASELRFRGFLPEGDLRSLRRGAPMRVDLPGHDEPVVTELLGPMPIAEPTTRRVQIEATTPNPERKLPQGLSAMGHVQVRESAHEEVLLPAACVVADGLEMIVFRRDSKDPGIVVRTPVELGLRGAGVVEVLAGVLDGDSVVQRGVHQLKQTGLGKPPLGGHFHADGSWHEAHE